MDEGTHDKQQHWLKKDSVCRRDNPDFEVEKNYSIHWDTRVIEDINIYYTLLTI